MRVGQHAISQPAPLVGQRPQQAEVSPHAHILRWHHPCARAGTIPAEWAHFTNLQHLFVKPGNPLLCGPLPALLPFKVR